MLSTVSDLADVVEEQTALHNAAYGKDAPPQTRRDGGSGMDRIFVRRVPLSTFIEMVTTFVPKLPPVVGQWVEAATRISGINTLEVCVIAESVFEPVGNGPIPVPAALVAGLGSTVLQPQLVVPAALELPLVWLEISQAHREHLRHVVAAAAQWEPWVVKGRSVWITFEEDGKPIEDWV